MPQGKIKALFILAWALVRSTWKKLVARAPRGIALFEANYASEGLTRISAGERQELAGLSGCIACGRCNQGDGERIARSRGAYPGTMALMLASSRSMPDFAAAAPALSFISDTELAAKEKLCPTAVPMRRVAAFIRAHAVSETPRESGENGLVREG